MIARGTEAPRIERERWGAMYTKASSENSLGPSIYTETRSETLIGASSTHGRTVQWWTSSGESRQGVTFISLSPCVTQS